MLAKSARHVFARSLAKRAEAFDGKLLQWLAFDLTQGVAQPPGLHGGRCGIAGQGGFEQVEKPVADLLRGGVVLDGEVGRSTAIKALPASLRNKCRPGLYLGEVVAEKRSQCADPFRVKGDIRPGAVGAFQLVECVAADPEQLSGTLPKRVAIDLVPESSAKAQDQFVHPAMSVPGHAERGVAQDSNADLAGGPGGNPNRPGNHHRAGAGTGVHGQTHVTFVTKSSKAGKRFATE